MNAAEEPEYRTLRRARLVKAGSNHPDRSKRKSHNPPPGSPTSGRTSKVSGGRGERDKHHTHDERHKS
jgi:hypothetical protein